MIIFGKGTARKFLILSVKIHVIRGNMTMKARGKGPRITLSFSQIKDQ